jgi:hypothetical protein
MLRKDPTSLETKTICYWEELLSNRTNQNYLPLFLQNKAQLINHNLSPVNFNIIPDPVGPIKTSLLMAQTQVVADKAKEYGMNKLTPFTGN